NCPYFVVCFSNLLVNKFKCSIDIKIVFMLLNIHHLKNCVINGDGKEDDGIFCLKFILLKKKLNDNEKKLKDDSGVHLYYDSTKDLIRIFVLKLNLIFNTFEKAEMHINYKEYKH
ncbi:hypothetical protein RFI_36456, partial [Reticulomyxa filosa]